MQALRQLVQSVCAVPHTPRPPEHAGADAQRLPDELWAQILREQDASPFALRVQSGVSRQWQRVARSNTVWRDVQGHWPCVPKQPQDSLRPNCIANAFRDQLATLPNSDKRVLRQLWCGRLRYYILAQQLACDLRDATPPHRMLLFCAAAARAPAVCLYTYLGWAEHQDFSQLLLPRLDPSDLPKFFSRVPHRIREARGFLLQYLQRLPSGRGAPAPLGLWAADVEVAEAFLRAGGSAYAVSPSLHGNPVLLAALLQSERGPAQPQQWLALLSDGQRDDAAFLQPMVRQHPQLLQHVSFRLRDDVGFVLPLLLSDGEVMQYAGPNIRDNRSCAKIAVSRSREAWFSLSPRLQSDFTLFAFVHPFTKEERNTGSCSMAGKDRR